MKIESKRFGTIEIKDDRVLTLDGGLLGFSNITNFILVDAQGDPRLPFKWMISTEDPEVGFLVADPGMFFSDYVFDLTPEDASQLKIEKPEDITVVTLLTIPADPRMITANLRGPLVFNNQTRRGKQLVLNSHQYATKHFIFLQDAKDELKKASAVDAGAAVAFVADAAENREVKTQS
jgi:flagellar assembly factor FliW